MHSVPLVYFHFVLLFSVVVLDNESHYMTSYNLVFYCSIKKRNRFCKCLCVGVYVSVCVCVSGSTSCVMAITSVCTVQSLMSTLDREYVSVCDELQTSSR